MKPKIDLNSNLVKYILYQLHKQIEVALEAPQKIENAVIPIYAVPKSKAHNKKKNKPEQIGSGVLVNIKNVYFIFSANHVFKEFGNLVVLTSSGNGKLIESLTGERYCTRNDSFDASVFHIHSPLSEYLKKVAITLDDLDFDCFDSHEDIYIASGFRVKRSNTAGNSVKSKRECVSTVEYDLQDEYYIRLDFNSTSHIILVYEDQILKNGKWQTSPIPKGMSGGAIIRVDDTSTKTNSSREHQQKQLLNSIIIEHRRGKGEMSGILIGTRLNVFLGLIYQDMPEILEDFLISKEC